MAAITNEHPNPGQRAAEISRRAAEALRKLPWLNEAQAAVSWGVLIVLMAILGTVYLNQASRIAILGRQVQQLQFELKNVKRENAIIEQSVASVQELTQLQDRAYAMGYIRTSSEKIEYLVIPDYPVASETIEIVEGRSLQLEQPAKSMLEALWLLLSQRVGALSEGVASGP